MKAEYKPLDPLQPIPGTAGRLYDQHVHEKG